MIVKNVKELNKKGWKIKMVDKKITGKYYLQHFEKDYHEWYAGFENSHGLNSYQSPFEPIEGLLKEGEFFEDIFKTDATSEITVEIKIHKMTKKEEKDWMNK